MFIKKYFFLTLLGIILIASPSLWATKFGSDIVIQCPNSSRVLRQQTLMSGNSGGAISWSDGYTFLPMLPEPPVLARCEGGAYFWISEAKILGEMPRQNKKAPEAWKQAPLAPALSASEYLEAIAQKVAKNPHQERYLRIKTWWSINDRVRESKQSAPTSPYQNSSPEKDNLEALLKLLDTSDPDQLLMKAEALRELGRFQEALELLKTPLDKGFQETQKKLIQLAEKKDVLVRKFSE